jgi:hypothetical protein
MRGTTTDSHSLTNARSEGRQMTNKGSFKTTLRRRLAKAALALTALGAVVGVAAPAASAFELESAGARYTDANGAMARQAGYHADILNNFSLGLVPLVPKVEVKEMVHRIKFEQPPGVLANAVGITQCPETGMKAGAGGNQAICPVGSQIGIASVGTGRVPIYNVTAPYGTPALFAFNYLGSVIRISPTVRPGDYGITMDSGVVSQGVMFQNIEITFWGVPADPIHDPNRWVMNAAGTGMVKGGPSPDMADPKPFTSLPTSCPGAAAVTNVTADGWDSQGLFVDFLIDKDLDGEDFRFSGCDQLGFEPTVEARPTTNLADSPSGLDVSIKMPQGQDPDGFSEAQLRDAVITFPKGMTVNPASGDGLGACTPAQIGLTTPVGQPKAVFDGAEANCPNNSKLGTVQIDTPLLDHPMPGAIYLATQNQNPFGSLLALYIAVDDPQSGVRIKLAGEARPDPKTGQLTASFANNPQQPFTEFKVNLFTGPRAALKTPLSCGQFETTTTMVPWSSPTGADANPTDSFLIEKGANGGACLKTDAQAPNVPTFGAGTLDPSAGAYSPFVLKLTRADGTAPIKAIDATLPKGLLGKLAGIPYCPDANLVVAAAKSGKVERAAASCSPASRVGSVNVSAGAGSTPLQVSGTAYLAGPYKGAPLSLAIVTPAVAGPFDLGTVVVRTALQVDPETTQIHAVSDEIPTILQGIPLDIRQIALNMDRPSFTLNPTSCDPMAVLGGATSVFNQTASLSSPFQVGGCGGLGFKPKLSLSLKGGTARSKFPALRAELNARPGDANIAKAVVSLPHSEFLAQEHIRTVCTRVQFAANNCPKGAIYGSATAWSPLLDQPLTGPVYLRSSSNPLPDLVADLNGQIRVSLVGRIDSIRGGIRNSFELVPDAPVSKFVLQMQGGKKGLLVNSRDLCKSVNKVDARFTGQNGKTHNIEPVLTNSCKKKAKKKTAHKRTAR